MNAVTRREAGPDLASLLEEVEHGRYVILTRDGAPVARVVRETGVNPSGWTPEKQKALDESMALALSMPPMEPWRFDRDEIHEERLERQHKPWRGQAWTALRVVRASDDDAVSPEALPLLG